MSSTNLWFPRLSSVALVGAFALGSPTVAQDGQATAQKWSFEAALEGFMYENFFQAPSGAPQESIQAFNGSFEAIVRPLDDRPLELFASVASTSYSDNLGDSPSFGAGVRWDGPSVGAEASVDYEADRPTVDVGDALGVADTTRLSAEYGYRFTDDWETTLRVRHHVQRFQRVEGRDNDVTTAGVALRYRGWGYGFSPEVGFDLGSRDATDRGEDLDQLDYWIQLRSIPSDALYLSLRYRYRTRDYTVQDIAASNFDREDDRQQVALTIDYQVTEPWSIGAYFAHQDADSTRPTRIFDTKLVVIGTKIRF